jgi:hypothetical protein
MIMMLEVSFLLTFFFVYNFENVNKKEWSELCQRLGL